MKIARYFCLAAVILTLAGCYEDKGNYEYEDLLEPVISVPWSTEVVQGETLRIEAELEPQSPRTVDDYVVEWYIESEKAGEGLVLEIPNYQGIMGTRNTNMVIVRDKLNDAKYVSEFTITTTAPMQSGWAILSDDGGQTKLHFIRETRVMDDVNEDLVVGQTFTPFLDCVEGLPASPKKLIEHWSTSRSALGEVAVLCDQNQVWELSGDNLAKVVDLKMEFMDETLPVDLNTAGILYAFHGSYVYSQDGNMYGRRNNDMEGYHTGRYLPLPVQPSGGGMKVGFAVNVIAGYYTTQALVYDSEHKRYIVITDDYYSSDGGELVPVTRYSSSVGEDAINTIDLSNMGDVKIYGCTPNVGGYFDTPYYAIVEKEGRFYVQDFSIEQSYGSVSCTNYTLTEISWGNLVSDDSQFIINDKGDYMFFTSGDKIYYNRRNTDQPKVFESYDGVKVTSIALDVCEYDWYQCQNWQFGVGLEDGRFIIYDVSPTGINEVNEGREPVEIYEHNELGNIKSVIYKIGTVPNSRGQ